MPTGLFVTFEGPEGGGKSTQIRRLATALEGAGHDVVTTREPGGTPAAERLRAVLLDPGGTALQPATEAFLMCGARAEHVADVIRPALEDGRVVLCDRFADSTLAYQGYGRQLPLELLGRMNALATGGLTPDLTLLLDCPVEEGLRRRRADGERWNRLDAAGQAFHTRVRRGFRALAAAAPARWHVLDASRDVASVAADVLAVVSERLARAAAADTAER